MADPYVAWDQAIKELYGKGKRIWQRPKGQAKGHPLSYQQHVRLMEKRLNQGEEIYGEGRYQTLIQQKPQYDFNNNTFKRDNAYMNQQIEQHNLKSKVFNNMWKQSSKHYKMIQKAKDSDVYVGNIYQSWRVLQHGGVFSKLGPKGAFSNMTIFELTISTDFRDVLGLMYENKTAVINNEVTIRNVIENRILKPTVRYGVDLVMQKVPMMGGTLRKSMVNSLREYVRFESGAKGYCKIYINTFGVDYAKPVNNMPTDNLQHHGKLQKKNGKVYYLRDVNATTHFFQEVVEKTREFAKKKWNLFVKNYLLPLLDGHRPITPTEQSQGKLENYEGFSADLTDEFYDEEIIHETEPRLVKRREYEERKQFEDTSIVDNLVGALLENPTRLNKTQKAYVERLMSGSQSKGYASTQFVNLFFKVKFSGGSY